MSTQLGSMDDILKHRTQVYVKEYFIAVWSAAGNAMSAFSGEPDDLQAVRKAVGKAVAGVKRLYTNREIMLRVLEAAKAYRLMETSSMYARGFTDS